MPEQRLALARPNLKKLKVRKYQAQDAFAGVIRRYIGVYVRSSRYRP
jgi:hypothetical protein